MNGLIKHITYSSLRKILTVGVILFYFSFSICRGQHDVQFTQYFSNHLILNPAYAGADEALSISLVNRNQWTGVDGAPNTTTLSAHTLFKNEHTGLGMNFVFDKINIHSNASFTGIYSYRIKTSASSYLSLGLQAGINYLRSDYTSLLGTLQDPNDVNIGTNNVSASSIQFGTGMYYKSRKLEVGLSAPIIYATGDQRYSDEVIRPKVTPHYFLFTRYKIDLSHQVSIHPGFLIKGKTGWPLSIDLNVDALINEVLMLGLSYRSYGTLGTIIQAKILPQMKFGYSFDIPLKAVQYQNFKTHEIMLNYIFQYKTNNVKSPR